MKVGKVESTAASNHRVNLFHASGLYPYPLKISENWRFCDVFSGYRKRPVAWNRLKTSAPYLLLNQLLRSILSKTCFVWLFSRLFLQSGAKAVIYEFSLINHLYYLSKTMVEQLMVTVYKNSSWPLTPRSFLKAESV